MWSDLKNNTKKKAAKINRAACGTGGGPALQAILSELEQRVLNIMGPQAATGLLGVAEAGFIQVCNISIINLACRFDKSSFGLLKLFLSSNSK